MSGSNTNKKVKKINHNILEVDFEMISGEPVSHLLQFRIVS